MKELEFRDIQFTETQNDNELLIVGHIPVNSWSETLGESVKFKEIIEPGTFQRALDNAIANGRHIDFFGEHDPKNYMASTRNGSLKLQENENGLQVEARFSKTTVGEDFYTMIKDQLIRGLSFGMRVLKDNWKKLSDGTFHRSITDLELFEISAVRNPAYLGSHVEARSIEIVIDPKINLKNTEEFNMSVNLKEFEELRADFEEMAKKLGADIGEVHEVRTVSAEQQQMDIETRAEKAVVDFMIGAQNEEVRAITTGTAQATIPTHLSNQIVEKLVEEAAIFSRAKRFAPTSGTLEILRDQGIGEAAFVGELEGFSLDNTLDFDKVELKQKRAGSAMKLTQQLVNDSGIDVLSYSVDVLAKRLGRKLDEQALIGGNGKSFQGILTADLAKYPEVLVGEHKALNEVTDEELIDLLLDMTLSVHPSYLDGATFIMNRQVFNRIAKAKDREGRYHVVRDVVNGKPAYKLFGQEILIQASMPKLENEGTAIDDVISVAFVNLGFAAASMVKQGQTLKRISDDTDNALSGTNTLLLEMYADFQILNENAIRYLKQKTTV